MKTVLIFDQCEANVEFFVLEGDYRELDKVYINAYKEGATAKEQKANEKLQNKLNKLLYHQKTGEYLHPVLHEFPTQAVRDGAEVIVAGFLP
jgi:hypothetical protein